MLLILPPLGGQGASKLAQTFPKKHLHQNIFNNPLTFINDQMEFGNGDGILFYPGRVP